MEKVVALCSDVGDMVEVRDIEAYRLFQKESNNQLSKRTIVKFVNRRFAEDLLSKRNISSTLNFNKLGCPKDTLMLTYVGTIKNCGVCVKN